MHYPAKRVLAALCACMLSLCACARAATLPSVQTQTIRVGYYHIDGYQAMDADGRRSGYGYEVLQAMKLFANWTYEYIGYDKGWADMQQMLLNGQIDLLVSAVKTPERAQIYDFSDEAISQSGACLLVRAGISPYVAGQYGTYNGMRVGFIENSSQIASMEAFANEKGFAYDSVYYKTSADLESALRGGADVDAVVTSNMRKIAGTRRLDLFDMQNVHVMVRKGDAALLAQVNYALSQIHLCNPGLYDALYNKYYSVDTGDQVYFTPEESLWLNACREDGVRLRAALVPDLSPYAYYENGAPAGILYDITSEILRRTGLDCELIATQSIDEYRSLIENRGADLRLAARADYNYAESLGYTLISAYYATDVSRVTRKDFSGSIRSIAVVRDSLIDAHYLAGAITNETIVRYDTLNQSVRAVQNGECDALYVYTRTAQEIVYEDITNRLTSVIMPGYEIQFSIGVREDADARLASILEKASASLSRDDIARMVLKYTDDPIRPASILGALYANPIFVIAMVAFSLFAIFAIVTIVLIAGKRRLEKEKNRQLRDALALAKRANTAKSVFMSRMSHEIRTPLNAIIGYNSMSSGALAEAKNTADTRKAAMKAVDCLAKSEIASRHLLTVINDVLDMSAIESGKIKIAREPFDFKGTISALTALFSSQASAKGVNFQAGFDTPVEDWLVGDQTRVNQILTNLLSNAIKFTSQGGSVRLKMRQTNAQTDTAHIHFEVSDTGIGMSEDFMIHIWQPFEQADASISRRFGGTGLGLSITKNLVDLMGGEIRVESKLASGTTFFVDLAFPRVKRSGSDPVYNFAGMRVLVADDDLSTRDYLSLLFERSGVACVTVSTGDEALTALQSGLTSGNRFTICMIDWRMPGKSGYETIREIRRMAGEKLPIIAISAYDYADVAEEAKAAGVNHFLTKPLFQSEVFDLLATLCGAVKPSAPVRSRKANFGGAHVLLAEDNKMNMEIAAGLLNTWNLTIEHAWNGREAVEMFTSSPAGTYKAILMDVHMPEMDGYAATRAIRACAHAQAATIPIIAMTADVFAEDIAEASAAGMNAHVGKPIVKAHLLNTLKTYIPCAEAPD